MNLYNIPVKILVFVRSLSKDSEAAMACSYGGGGGGLVGSISNFVKRTK